MAMVVINLFGQPGAGKSTLAAYTFAKMKMMNINCELVTEFAKDKVWEKNNTALANQIYIFGKQYYRLDRCSDKVDVIITDSPIALSPIYNKDTDIDEYLKKLVFKVSNKFNNLNYFVKRIKKYNPTGRLQTEKESDRKGEELKEYMKKFGIKYNEIVGDLISADVIINDVLKIIGEKRI